jgi:hypothetical protein
VAELRQDLIRIDGLFDEHDMQLGSVTSKNRHRRSHPRVCQQHMDRS